VLNPDYERILYTLALFLAPRTPDYGRLFQPINPLIRAMTEERMAVYKHGMAMITDQRYQDAIDDFSSH
jgi:hypothetical protein